MKLHLAVLLAGALGLVGCGDDDSGPKTGTVTFAFSASNGVRQNPNLDAELNGAIYGSVFQTLDVSLTGPRDGAQDFASVEVAVVNLHDVMLSAETWDSPPIPEGEYTFLGFFDIDGNGAVEKDPDPGDPVTLPTINEFMVEPGVNKNVEISFDLVFN